MRYLVLVLLLLPGITHAQPTFTVRLAWVAPTTNVDGSPLTNLAGYEVAYSTKDGSWGTPIQVADPASVAYVLTQNVLQENTRYYFAVRAYNDQGLKSEWSASASGVTPDLSVPSAPRDVVVEIIFNAGQ